LRLAWFEHRGRIQADELIGAIRAVPYFEGRGFSTGDVDGHVERTDAEVMAFPYEVERSAIIERGLNAFRESPRQWLRPKVRTSPVCRRPFWARARSYPACRQAYEECPGAELSATERARVWPKRIV
jgi:hypothetical protein